MTNRGDLTDDQWERLALLLPPHMGEVPGTVPPGLVFSLGTSSDSSGQRTLIRFLTVEAQRIVIDVAGSSTVIDDVYSRLTEMLRGETASDHQPILGNPWVHVITVKSA